MKRLRKNLSLFLALTMLFQVFIPVSANANDKEATVIINDEYVIYNNKPVYKDGEIYVSLEETAEYLGLEIKGEDYNNGAYLTNGNESVWFQEGNMISKFGGEPITMKGSPVYFDEAFYIPISILESGLGYTLKYNHNARSVSLAKSYNFVINKENVAVTSNTSNGVFNGVKYDSQSNNASLDSGGKDYLSSHSNLRSEVYYKVDASRLLNEKIDKLILRFYAMRNYAGAPVFEIYNVIENWDSKTINYMNEPESDGLAVARFDTSEEGNEIENMQLSLVEVNVTSLSKYITSDNPYINIKITSSVTSNNQTTVIGGVMSENAPSIYAETRITKNYKSKAIVGEYESKVDPNEFSYFNFLKALGIFVENDEFSADENDLVTRAEMVDYVSRLRNDFTDYSRDESLFDDVDRNTPHYSGIIRAAKNGYISRGGNFEPDSPISIAEASKILVKVVGNDSLVEPTNEWYNGYMIVANRTKLFDGVKYSSVFDGITYTDMYRLLYNTLVSERLSTAIYTDVVDYKMLSVEKNMLKVYFNAYLLDGNVTATEFGDIYGGNGCASGVIKIDDVFYETNLKNDYELLGLDVLGCYTKNDTNDKGLIYAGIKNTDSIIIKAESVSSVKKDGNYILFKYYKDNKEKTIKLSNDVTIIYNGSGTKIPSEASKLEALFMPQIGALEFVDTSLCGDYGTVIITAYKNVFVSAVDQKEACIYDKYFRVGSIDLNIEDGKYQYTIRDLDGNLYDYTQLVENDVLSVAISKNGRLIDAILSRKNVTGTIESVEIDDQKYLLTINGRSCTAFTNEKNIEIELGISGTFYLDAFGNIAGYIFKEGEKRLGYLVDIGKNNNSLDNYAMLQIFTKGTDEQNIPVYKLKEKVTIDGVRKDSDVVYGMLSSGDEPIYQVIQFGTDSKGEINFINTIAPDVNGNASEELILRYDSSAGTMINKPPYLGGKYIIDSNTFNLALPSTTAGYTPTDKEQYFDVSAIQNNISVTADVYSLGKEKISADVVVLKDYASGTSFNISDVLSVVCARTLVLDKNGEVVEKMVISTNGNKQEIFIKESDSALFEGIVKGDVIRCAVDIKGYGKNVIKHYDYKTKEIMNLSGTFNDETHIFGGIAYTKNDGYVRIVENQNNVSDTDNVFVLDAKGAESVMYKYTMGRKDVDVSKATYNDIIDFQSAQRDAVSMLCQVTYGNQYKSVILLDLEVVFDGSESDGYEGDDAVEITYTNGTETKVNKYRPGNTITLPDKLFVKPLMKIRWTDGIKTYEGGSNYVVPYNNITLTAIYEPVTNWTLNLEENNVAATSAAMPTANIADKSSSGYDEINSISGGEKYIYYRFDASDLVGKLIGKAELVFNASRNWSYFHSSKFNIYEVTDAAWNPETTTFNNTPTVADSPMVSQELYKILGMTSSEAGTYIGNDTYGEVRVDITDLLKNITDEDPYVDILLETESTTSMGGRIKGVGTGELAPKIDISDISTPNKITFEGGEGTTGAVSPIYGMSNDVITLPICTFVKENYAFEGWSDGIKTYTAGESYTFPEKDVVLTAKWKAATKISFVSGEGATGVMTPQYVLPGNNLTLPECPFVKPNYAFTGWNDGNSIYNAGDTYPIGNTEVVFTAQWEVAPTITFTGGAGATGTVQPISALSGSNVTLPRNGFTNNGCIFAGWKDGKTIYAAGAKYTMPNSDITLTAVWNAELTSYTEESYLLTSTRNSSSDAWGIATVSANPSKKYVGIVSNATKQLDGYTFVKFDATSLIGKNVDDATLQIEMNRQWSSAKTLVAYTAESKSSVAAGKSPTSKTAIGKCNANASASGWVIYSIDISSLISGLSTSNPYIELMLYTEEWGGGDVSTPCIANVRFNDKTKIICTNVR